MTERMPEEPDVRPNEAPPRLWVYIDALRAALADARLEAENYRRVAKLCTIGHEQAEQRAAEYRQNAERLKEAADGWKMEAERLRRIERAMQFAEQRAAELEAKLAEAEKVAEAARAMNQWMLARAGQPSESFALKKAVAQFDDAIERTSEKEG